MYPPDTYSSRRHFNCHVFHTDPISISHQTKPRPKSKANTKLISNPSLPVKFQMGPPQLILPPPSNWCYRIEGAQKAIFALAPFPTNPINQQHPEPPPQALCVYTTLLDPQSRHQNPYNPNQQAHFRRYLSHYLIQRTPIRLSPSYLSYLAQAAEPFRPPSRRRFSSISAASSHAELLPDIALRYGSETILVELKPKSGVLSRSALVHPSITTTLQKFHLPIYHLKNYILPDGVSGPLQSLPDPTLRYNPVDLLSGVNIRKQLFNLHRENSRSLRIFSSGQLLMHSSSHQICNNRLCHVALDVAARALAGRRFNRKSVLAGLREIQNMDYIDNIGAAFLLDRLVKALGKGKAYKMISRYLYEEDDMPMDQELMRAFLDAKRIISYDTAADAARLHCEERYRRAVNRAMQLEPCFMAKMIADFMQAAAAKDCSVMVAICRRADAAFAPATDAKSDDDRCRVVTNDGEEWLYSVNVVDTGEKSIDKILNKWAAIDLQRTDKILAAGGF